jgi:subtilisin family serine protease
MQQNLYVKMGFLDSAGNRLGPPVNISALTNRNDTTIIKINSDSLWMHIIADSAYPGNRFQHIAIEFENSSRKYYPYFLVTGTGTVHVLTPYITLSNSLNPSGTIFNGFTSGDLWMNQRNPGGTAKQIIAVGSYNSKASYQSLDGTIHYNRLPPPLVGSFSEFSSHGPTADGRVKPDVCAPGSIVIAALKSTDRSVGNNVYAFNGNFRGTMFPYGGNSGTSMACPVVAGIVALLMEQNPQFSPMQVRDLLRNSARIDSFTGPIAATGSNYWGFGKVDVFKAVIQATNPLKPVSATFWCYPNPCKGYFKIPENTQPLIMLKLTDLGGKVQKVFFRDQEFNISDLGAGLYKVEAHYPDYVRYGKLVLAP